MKKLVLFIILAACLIAGGLLLYEEWEARRPPTILINSAEPTPEYINAVSPDVPTSEPNLPIDTTEEPAAPTPADDDKTHTPESNDFGTVTIKGKTFPVKRGVSEKALAGNIGWMESSAQPGADGMCILMGHRNQQFRILKDVQAGDKIIIGATNGFSYYYIVQLANIVENDKTLRFEAAEGKTLVLVTCYPFYFRGHAPQKFVVKALMR